MGKIFNILKSPLQQSLIPTPIIILIILFFNLKTVTMCGIPPKNYPVSNNITEIRIINHLQDILRHKKFNGSI
jgi:hypothetical protein